MSETTSTQAMGADMTWDINKLHGRPGSKEQAEAFRRKPGTAWWEPMAVRPDTVAHPCVLRPRKRTTRGKNRTAFYEAIEPRKESGAAVVTAIAATVRLSAKDMRAALASIAGLPCSDQAGTAYQAVTIARQALGQLSPSQGDNQGRDREGLQQVSNVVSRRTA